MALAVIGIGSWNYAAFVHLPEIASALDDNSEDYFSQTDVIDRADYPLTGSGPVYIGHARCDSLRVKAGTKLYNSSFSGGGITYPSNGILFSRAQPFTPVPQASNSSLGYYSIATYQDERYFYMFHLRNNSRRNTYYDPHISLLGIYRQPLGYTEPYVTKRGSYLRFQPVYSSWNRLRQYGYPKTTDELYQKLCDVVTQPIWDTRYDYYLTQYVYYVGDGCEKAHADLSFLTDVYPYWLDRSYGMPGTARGSMSNSGPAAAYYAAFDKLPRVTSNSIASVLDILSTIKSFSKGYSGVGSARDAWLSYRYAYSTTVSDIKSFSEVASRWADIKSHPIVKSHAAITKGKYTYKCTITCDLSKLFSSDLSAKIEKYNALPTLTNVWDMIPYSFVADWFTDIGEILSSIDTWLAEESYPITEVWYSISYHGEHNGVSTSEYCRWLGNIPALPSICYGTSGYVASTKTKAKRFVDAICLAPFERR